MKEKVGYSLDILNNFAVNLENIKELRDITEIKVMGSFYKILMGERDMLEVYDKEVVSILLALSIASKSLKGKFYRKTFQEICKKAVVPGLNRGLYDQESISGILRRNGPKQMISILGAEAVSRNKLERAVSLLMIMVGKDLEELLISIKDLKKLLVEKGLLKKTFISLEDIINEH